MTVLSDSSYSVLLIFDGVCVLCNKTVSYIISKDNEEKFCFTSNDSLTARKIMNIHNLDAEKNNSVILYEIHTQKIYTRAMALRKIAIHLKGISKLSYIAFFMPRFFLDRIYNIIERYRYKIYGTLKACPLNSEIKKRYIY